MLSAFSAGTPQSSAIAVTEGLLRRLTMREIAGVLAREISHIAFGDLTVLAHRRPRHAAPRRLMYYAGLALAALNLYRLLIGDELVSWWSVALLVLAPALLNLLQLSLSRTREFEADRAGALLTGDPLGLASAISRLEASTGTVADDLIPPVPARKVPQPSMLRCPPPLRPAHCPPPCARSAADAAAGHRRGPAHLARRRRTDRDAPALPLAGGVVLATP